MRADFFKLVGGAAHLGVSAIGFEIVGENSFPVSFLVGGDGGPVPVLDHVRAIGEVGVNVLSKLSVVGRELAGGTPADGLGVGLGDQEICVLE